MSPEVKLCAQEDGIARNLHIYPPGLQEKFQVFNNRKDLRDISKIFVIEELKIFAT